MAEKPLLQTRPMNREGYARFSRSALPDDIGRRIRHMRTNAGWTRTKLARSSKISYRTVVRIESGKQKPTEQTLRRIATAFAKDIDDLCPNWLNDEINRVSSGDIHLGVGFRVIRKTKKITLKAASYAAGVSISTLSRFERAFHVTREFSAYDSNGRHSFVIPNAKLTKLFGFDSIELFVRACEEANAEE